MSLLETAQVANIVLCNTDVITQITIWCLWGCSSTVTDGVLARLKMQIAVVQQAGQVTEITDWTQTLQLLSHVGLFPTAVTSTHLDRRGGGGEKTGGERFKKRNTTTLTIQEGPSLGSMTYSAQCSGTSISLPHSRVQCTGTCSGVYRTPPSCLRSGCAASSDRCRSSMCRDARDDLCYEPSGHVWRVAYSLDTGWVGCYIT